MKIVLLGAPGAGKGTQASKLCEKLKIPHISTGDIFRENIKNGTEVGLKAKSYIDKGQLVPDEVTVEIVNQRIMKEDCANGFLLDGFPRNTAQAIALDKITKLDYAVNIVIPLDRLMKRLTGRRVCTKCGESFHIDFLKGAKVCSVCGGELYVRPDDNEQTVASRLNVYTEQTAPLIEYYQAKGILKNVDGDRQVEDVLDGILKAVK